MEYRRLQSTGGSSLTVTLPKAWVQQTNLKTQDRVYTRISGAHLIMTPEAIKQAPSIARVACSKKTPTSHLQRELIASFISGADTIECESTDSSLTSEQLACIEAIVSNLFGFEIVESTASRYVLRNILDRNKISTTETLLKMAQIISNMVSDARTVVEHQDKDVANSIIRRDREADTLNYVLKRHFNRVMRGILYDTLSEVSYSRSISIQLERIGDHVVTLVEHSLNNKTGSSEAILATLDALKNAMETAISLFDTKDNTVAQTLLDDCYELEKDIASKKEFQDSYNLAFIQNSLDRICGYIINMAEVTIDTQYVKAIEI